MMIYDIMNDVLFVILDGIDMTKIVEVIIDCIVILIYVYIVNGFDNTNTTINIDIATTTILIIISSIVTINSIGGVCRSIPS